MFALPLLPIRPSVTASVPQRGVEGIKPLGSKGKLDEQTDSLEWLSTDSLNTKRSENCKPIDLRLSGNIYSSANNGEVYN